MKECNLIIVWIDMEGDIHDDDDLPNEVVRSTSRDNSTSSHCLTALVDFIPYFFFAPLGYVPGYYNPRHMLILTFRF